jgi:hypothetical protein
VIGESIAKAVLSFSTDNTGLNTGIGQVKGQVSGLESSVQNLGATLAAAFTVTAVVTIGKQVLDFADELTNLSAKTGIGTTGLQKLQLAFQGSGVSLDTVTRSVGELGARLVGDKGAQAMVQKLGLNLEELKHMTPEEKFIKAADAVGKIQDKGEQLYASKTLFGKGGVEILQGLDGHLEETTKKFEDMGLIVDEQTVAAADNFGDQLGIVGKQLLAVAANAIGPMLPALTALASGFSVVANVLGQTVGFVVKGVTIAIVGLWEGIATLLGNLAEMAQKIPFVGQHLTGLAGAADWLRDSAAKSDAMITKLALGTTAVATTATAAKTPLLGLGDDIQKVGKKSEWTAAQLKEIGEQIAMFDKASRSVQMFYAAVGQDMVLQNVKVHVAEFQEPFKELQRTIPVTMQYLGNYMARWKETAVSVSASAKDMADHSTSAFGSLTDGLLGSLDNLWKGMSGGKGFAGLMHNLGDSIVNGFGNILSGGLTSVINMGVQMAVEGVKKIGSLIAGLFQSEETKKVNKPRDQFQLQFGSTKDAGGANLINMLMDQFFNQGDADGEAHAHALFQQLQDADTEAKFKSAQQAIAEVLKAAGKDIQMFATGGIVTRPTLGVFGEAGPEVVMPLDRLRSFIVERETTQTIILRLDSRELTRAVVQGMPRELSLAGLV